MARSEPSAAAAARSPSRPPAPVAPDRGSTPAAEAFGTRGSARRPDATFAGVLESPLDDAEPVLGEAIEVRGWALAGAQPGVVVRLADGPAVTAATGLQRSDVAEAYADIAGAERSGFVARVSLAGLAPGVHDLEVRVENGPNVVHRWLRPIRIADIDVEFRAWQARCRALVEAPAGDPGPGSVQATWIVRSDGAQREAADATAQALRDAGRGRWQALILEPGADETALRDLGARAEGRWIGLLDAGDRVRDDAGARLAPWLDSSAADLVYADHDHVGAEGPVDPVLKPGWSPWLLDHPDVASRAWLVRRERLDLDAWRRLAACGRGTASLPAVLGASGGDAVRVPEVLFTLQPTPAAAAARPREPQGSAAVTVIVPSRLADRDLLGRCLDGLRQRTDYPALDIVVALNNIGATTPADAAAFLAPWRVRILHSDAPFSWSALNNAAVRGSGSPWLLFLNDDVEPLDPGWLRAMVALGDDPRTGAIGAVLRYPDGRIQHAGIYAHGGERPECRHTFRHCSGSEPRVRRWLARDRAQTAVTGACLLTRRADFEALGGFDETLPLVFNDVDYCLRLGERGFACVVAAHAELCHHEGLSRGGIAEEADRRRFTARWGASLPRCDRFSHPALKRDRDDWMFDPGRAPTVAEAGA